MVERIYYRDSKLIKFDANIIKKEKTKNGNLICLDQTAFYPTSGGQPCDLGTIDGKKVVDVWEKGEEIWHKVEAFPTSNQIKGIIYWSRRFDHMQQHTGQHLLSAVFVDLIKANTIGFHIGGQATTVDFNIKELSNSQIIHIENNTNQLIWENHPIEINYIGYDEISDYSFRKLPQKLETIRVVKIGDFDLSACGGTHVESTGEIGMLKIIRNESYKGGLRVHFVCGKRCLQHYQNLWNITNLTISDLTINLNDLPQTVKRMGEKLNSYRLENKKLKINLLTKEAEKIWGQTGEKNGLIRVFSYFEDRPIDDLQMLAKLLCQYPNTIAILAGNKNDRTNLICSRSSNLDDIDADSILKEAFNLLGGNGGGSQFHAEGGSPTTDPAKTCKIIQSILEKIK